MFGGTFVTPGFGIGFVGEPTFPSFSLVLTCIGSMLSSFDRCLFFTFKWSVQSSIDNACFPPGFLDALDLEVLKKHLLRSLILQLFGGWVYRMFRCDKRFREGIIRYPVVRSFYLSVVRICPRTPFGQCPVNRGVSLSVVMIAPGSMEGVGRSMKAVGRENSLDFYCLETESIDWT